jgi:hypothetical protein
MRRFLSVLGLFALGAFAGCHHTCTHGVCDCEMDDHCFTRAPWVKYAAPPPGLGVPVETVPAPGLPPVKEMPKAVGTNPL